MSMIQTGTGLLPSTTTQTGQYDPLLMGTLTDIINAARTQANTPYTPYPGQRYAQITPDELQANQAVRDNFLSTQPMYNQAVGLVNQGTTNLNNLTGNMGQWNPQLANQYMNPSMSQVIQAQTANMVNNANIERNRVRSNAAMSGAFGGGRQAVAEAQLADDFNRRLDTSTSDLLMQGYNTAFDQFNKDRGFGLDAVKQYGAQGDLLSGLAGARNNAYYSDVNNLSQVGKGLRDIAQANLDYDYGNFVNQRDYGKNQLGWISGLLQGTNLGNFQTGATETKRTQLPGSGSSFASNLMTGLGYAANLANSDLGKSIGSWVSNWFANGGLVDGYAAGGKVTKPKDKKQPSPTDKKEGDIDLSEGFYDNAPSKPFDEEALMEAIRQRYGAKGYAEGGLTYSDRMRLLREQERRRLQNAIPFPYSQDDTILSAMGKNVGNIASGIPLYGGLQEIIGGAGQVGAGVLDYLNKPVFSQMPPELLATGMASAPTNITAGQSELPVVDVGIHPSQMLGGRASSTSPTTIGVMLDNELAQVNQPPSVTDLLPQDSQSVGITLADLFPSQETGLDQLFNPNPLLMQGLYQRVGQMDVMDPGWWQAAAQIDAMNASEGIRRGRMQDTTTRGSAIGTLSENRAERMQRDKLERDKMAQQERLAAITDPLDLLRAQKLQLEIGKLRESGSGDYNQLSKMFDDYLKLREGASAASSVSEQERLNQRADELYDMISGRMGATPSNIGLSGLAEED